MAMPRNLSALRSKLEAALAGRIPAPFAVRDRNLFQMVSAGVAEIDFLAGGLPRGGLTEIYGPFCSGRTSLLLSALASRTTTGEVCALVDGCDSFDPHSAQAAGVELKKLLWVRCRNLDHAIRATDLLLQGGGFSLIALDLSDVAWKNMRHVPLHAWFRLRRAVENTPTILILLNREPQAKTCASLVLCLEAEPTCRITAPGTGDPNFFREATEPQSPLACLFDGFRVRAERIRSRMQSAPALTERSTSNFKTGAFWTCFRRVRSGTQ